MKERLKDERGITLVALVVTIIVLLILAAVSINLVLGENGIITRSKEASKVSFKNNVQEALELVIADVEISKRKDGGKAEISDLLDQGYIDNNCVININKLLGETGPYGNGTGKQDVFIIDNSELWYYDQEGQGEKISDLGDLGYLPTAEEYFEVYEESEKKCVSIKNHEEYYEIFTGAKGKEAPLEIYVIPNIINGETIEMVGHFTAPNIKKVIISDGFLEIGTGAFQGSTGLIDVKIPKSITSIGGDAFGSCTSLKSIDIPESITYIGESSFYNCEMLEEVNLKEGLLTISGGAFCNCTSLENIKLPNSINSMGMSTFSSCSNLKSINVPNNMTKIPYYLFENCTNLESVIIPKNITEIGYRAFYGCTSLNTVNYTGTEEEWNAININNGNDLLTNATINCNYTE